MSGIDAVKDGLFIANVARDIAADLRKMNMEAIGVRLELCAEVIEALHGQLRAAERRAEQAEGQARINAETVIKQQQELRKLEQVRT